MGISLCVLQILCQNLLTYQSYPSDLNGADYITYNQL